MKISNKTIVVILCSFLFYHQAQPASTLDDIARSTVVTAFSGATIAYIINKWDHLGLWRYPAAFYGCSCAGIALIEAQNMADIIRSL